MYLESNLALYSGLVSCKCMCFVHIQVHTSRAVTVNELCFVSDGCHYSVSQSSCCLAIFGDRGSVHDARHTSQAALSRTVLLFVFWSMTSAVHVSRVHCLISVHRASVVLRRGGLQLFLCEYRSTCPGACNAVFV